MLSRIGPWEVIVIAILVFVLFGHAKIPDMMKNLASGIKVFKKELKSDDGKECAPADKKEAAPVAEKPVAKSAPVKKPAAKKVAKKKPVSKK